MRRATLSLSEAAEALGLNVATLKAACRSGELESAVVSGRKRLVTEAALGAWLGSPDAARAAFDRASVPDGGEGGVPHLPAGDFAWPGREIVEAMERAQAQMGARMAEAMERRQAAMVEAMERRQAAMAAMMNEAMERRQAAMAEAFERRQAAMAAMVNEAMERNLALLTRRFGDAPGASPHPADEG